MSCNIDNWKTKKLDNLVIPIKSFYESKRNDWHPSKPIVTDIDTMEVMLNCGCGQTIYGILKDGMLTVTKFEMYGEGSGTFVCDILKPALTQSTGELEAILFWETSEVYRLTVKDGIVSDVEIEID